jgi:hypothetical protein
LDQPLIRCRLSDHIAPSGEVGMEGKARYVFPIVITAIIVFVVSGVVTFFNIGLRADFVPRWLSAFVVGWPIAAVTAFFALPFARVVTQRIVDLIDGAI